MTPLILSLTEFNLLITLVKLDVAAYPERLTDTACVDTTSGILMIVSK